MVSSYLYIYLPNARWAWGTVLFFSNYDHLAGFVLKKHKKMLEEKKDEISLEELIEKEVLAV